MTDKQTTLPTATQAALSFRRIGELQRRLAVAENGLRAALERLDEAEAEIKKLRAKPAALKPAAPTPFSLEDEAFKEAVRAVCEEHVRASGSSRSSGSSRRSSTRSKKKG